MKTLLMIVLFFCLSFQDSSEVILSDVGIKIGEQIWASKNLDVSHFRNGDEIPQALYEEDWLAAGENKEPAWCYYYNTNSEYGKLYNWYAVHDSRDLAPEGWEIPRDWDWYTLEKHVGQEKMGAALKSKEFWSDGTNETSFTALPGGLRESDGTFNYALESAYFWEKSNDLEDEKGTFHALVPDMSSVLVFSVEKNYGLSVRCVKD